MSLGFHSSIKSLGDTCRQNPPKSVQIIGGGGDVFPESDGAAARTSPERKMIEIVPGFPHAAEHRITDGSAEHSDQYRFILSADHY